MNSGGNVLLQRSASIENEDMRERKQQMQEFTKMLLPIFSNLLSGVEKISNNMQNLEYALPALELIEEILDMMNKYRLSQDEKVVDQLRSAVQNFNQFYINMTDTFKTMEK